MASYDCLAESDDIAKTIQRVIDDRYPLARVLWQDLQHPPEPAARSTKVATRSLFLNRSATVSGPRPTPPPEPQLFPGSGTRSLTLTRTLGRSKRPTGEGHEALDRVVQRVIDMRYPETRKIWMNSREEPPALRTGSRSLTYGARPQTVPTSF
jgi:hypothetical protein